VICGYYIFLGMGGFPPPKSLTPDWTSTWDLDQWRTRLDRLAELGCNTLMVYLMGHRLPYPSQCFPGCVEADHPNVRGEFLQQVLQEAKSRRMRLIATLTTTGHCRAFATANPQLVIVGPNGTTPARGLQGTFDTHILCHHNPSARRYCLDVIDEVLTRYSGFDGVILHPPEFAQPCYCALCRGAFAQHTGQDLLKAPEDQSQAFFMSSYLQFQRQELWPLVRRLTPGARPLMFTIPWVFQKHLEQVAQDIEPDTIIVDWDYGLDDQAPSLLGPRLRRYGALGHSVWFMPTCGYAFNSKADRHAQEQAVLRMISSAHDAGVQDIVYFMGPRWWPSVEATSMKALRPGS
jgi:hypothetical protein